MAGKDAPKKPDLWEQLYLRLEAEEEAGLDRLPRSSDREPPLLEHALASLEKKVRVCRACALWEHRTHFVFGEGDPHARLMFVGEAPGFEEDRAGRPFVGRAGRLLDRMIKAMGFQRDEVFIANVLKCRPPDNRTPNAMEIEACKGYLEEQIRIIAPRVIVAMGAPAARTLLSRDEGIGALRGRAYPYGKDLAVQVVPTYHPAYLLRNEAEKPKVWKDLQLAMSLLDTK